MISLFRQKVMSHLQDIQVLPNLWRLDKYYYMRRGAFLNISFEH